MALFSKLPSWASILITVIAAVIVVGLVSWGTFTLVKPGPSKLPEEEEGVTKEEQKLAEDEFKDWKTYRNEEYGFEVRYPREMQVEAREIEEVYSSYIVNKWRDLADKVGKTTIFDFQPCGGKQLPPTSCTLNIDVLTTQILLTDFIVQDVGLDKFSLGEHGAPSFALIENSNIGGNDSQAYKIVIPGMGKYNRYYVKKDNALVIITDGLFWPSKNLGITGDQLSNQILSTFKFLE